MNLDTLLALEERVCFRVDALDAGRRLDAVLHKRVAGWAARARVTRWVREGRATVDGMVRRAARPCRWGEEIVLVAPKNRQDLGAESVDPDTIPLVARGPDWLVVDKPAGLAAHPARGQVKRTLAVALAQRYGAESEVGGPWLCHRLDLDTSGLVLVALTRAALTRLMQAFEAGRVRRFYAARVRGAVPWPVPAVVSPAGWDDDAPFITLDTALRLEETPPYRVVADATGQRCVTRVQVAGVCSTHSDLFIEPITGRQHQIRVHLATAGHPLLGDPFYGDAAEAGGRMMLHARALWVPGETPVMGAVPWDLTQVKPSRSES